MHLGKPSAKIRVCGMKVGYGLSRAVGSINMLSLLPILTANLIQPMAADFTVVSVERNEVFAGRLGRRVEQTIVAERDGKRYTIKLGRSHTAIRNSTRTFSAGDTFKPEWGTIVKAD